MCPGAITADTHIRFVVPLSPSATAAVCGSHPSPPGRNVKFLDALARDTHYKYLVVMLVAASTGFVIANWVGWQYYRNS